MKVTNQLSRLFLTTALLTLTTACADMNSDFQDSSVVNKVIGGTVVQDAPDHVGVILIERDGEFRQSCTSTLIDDDTILTAGHCFGIFQSERDNMRSLVDDGQVFVCLGEKNWHPKNKMLCPSGRMAQIIEYELHPKFAEKSFETGDDVDLFDYDIAVAHLSVSFPNVSKPQLATRKAHTEGRTASFGYGLKKTAVFQNGAMIRPGQSDNKLRQLNRKTMQLDRCNRLIDKTSITIAGFVIENRPASRNNICINVDENHDLCHGDSGGPTFIDGRLAGVTSRGVLNSDENGKVKGCDGAGPTILMNVRKFRSWIRSAMSN